jgi:predicted  nucleic acid-binding Zn-ribbon protein
MNATTKTLLSLQALEFPPRPEERRGHSEAGDGRALRAIQRLRGRLSAQLLHEYDYRKLHFGAHSVVPVDEGCCSGCRVVLSRRTLRLAQGRLTECEHCGRLVYNLMRHRRLRLEFCAA